MRRQLFNIQILANDYKSWTFFVLITLTLTTSYTNQEGKFAKSYDGNSIDYSVYGQGEPALVFVHGGLGCDKRVWDSQISYFKDKYKVVTLSLAGHGKSDSIRSDYTMEAFGKDVAAVVNKLKLKEVILVGHSMGGLVTIEAALNLSDKVVGIIGLDCLNEFELVWSKDQIESFANWFGTNTNEKIKNYIRQMFAENTDTLLIERTANNFGTVSSPVFFNEMNNWFDYQNEKFIKSIQKLTIPITCIQNGDNIITTEINKKYNQDFNGIKMNNLKHFFLVSYPGLVNPTIESAIIGILNHKK